MKKDLLEITGWVFQAGKARDALFQTMSPGEALFRLPCYDLTSEPYPGGQLVPCALVITLPSFLGLGARGAEVKERDPPLGSILNESHENSTEHGTPKCSRLYSEIRSRKVLFQMSPSVMKKTFQTRRDPHKKKRVIYGKDREKKGGSPAKFISRVVTKKRRHRKTKANRVRLLGESPTRWGEEGSAPSNLFSSLFFATNVPRMGSTLNPFREKDAARGTFKDIN